MTSRYFFFLLLLTAQYYSFGQNTIGLPAILNYKKLVYGGGTQNWKITQDAKGILYFANNEGLLSFDGTFWKLYPLPNKTIVRSTGIDKEGRIYVGGQDEIGYFAPDKNGNLSFTSLKGRLPQAHRTFEDIWDIVCVGDDVFFRSSTKIFHLRQNQMRVHPSSTQWLFLGGNKAFLLAQDAQKGLLRFTAGSWQPFLQEKALPTDFQATSALAIGADSLLLTTGKHGLYLVTSGDIQPFLLKGAAFSQTQYFSSLIRVNEKTFALGTYTNGCYIVDKEGTVIQNFSRQTGLQNNNIRSLYCDQNRNIWLGLDNGIDFIAYDNAVKHINPASLTNGSGYASAFLNNHLYLGLSDGLFQLQLPRLKDISYADNDFSPVTGAEGQIWGLSTLNNKLLVNTHDGLYQLEAQQIRPVMKGTGFWTVQSQAGTAGNLLAVAGKYTGIQLLQVTDNIITARQAIPGFNESARFVTVDNNNTVWTSHPYRGVYKIEGIESTLPTVRLYTHQNGLPSSLNNHVYRVKNKIVIATSKGIYIYNRAKDVFEPAPEFQQLFGEKSIRYLKEDTQGNIWFIHDKNLGVVDFAALKPQLLYFPELKDKMVSGFEHINPINECNILVGAENGFYHINYEKYRQHGGSLNVYIRSVQALGQTDSLLYGGYSPQGDMATPRIPFHTNSFQIQYAAPFYEQQANISYSYYLEGFDKGWSDWTKKAEKDYTNLPAGSYTFHVKARSNLGNESVADSYSFVVLPPWYQTGFAYFVYGVMAVSLAFLLYKRHRKQLLQQQLKHQKEQQHLQYLHQLEIEKSEKEIVKLKNDKLESQIEFKNSELASTAMHLVKKGELLTRIKDELQHLDKAQVNEAELHSLKKIIRIISEEEKNNEDWEQFARHFNQVHDNFLILLKERYPNLTAHELKLCAYLRMNLSTKEIAQLVNISVRGVEISRYRLRKKLGIATEVNLYQFFLGLTSQKEKAPAAQDSNV
ncbi:transcriptional regulator [Flavisolibacter sp. BT320]|nr:transcriptional regulator [Flavisolibacter longurius]